MRLTFPWLARRPTRLPATLLLLSLAACTDDSQERLTEALVPQGIKSVVVNEEKVVVTCASDATVEVPGGQLERDLFGIASNASLTVVAKNILRDCEEKDSAKRQAEAVKAKIVEETKRLGIDATGLDDAATKQAICQKLTATLPAADPDRTVEATKNTQRWGCDTPPPPPVALAPPPAEGWVVELGQRQGKKPPTSFLRLQGGGGEKLTVRCTGRKKPDLYLQTDIAVKKRTRSIKAKLDGKKLRTWKVKPSTDGKALFFADVKGAFRDLKKAKDATFIIPGKKKRTTVSLSVDGFQAALMKLPRNCR